MGETLAQMPLDNRDAFGPQRSDKKDFSFFLMKKNDF